MQVSGWKAGFNHYNRIIKISIKKGVGTLARVMMHRFLVGNNK